MPEKPKAGHRPRAASRNKGGRPPYRPSIEERVVVEQMKFCGELTR